MSGSQNFQEQVWSRIRAICFDAQSRSLLASTECERFTATIEYIFRVRSGQNAARVSAAFLGYQLATPNTPTTEALVELAAALEIANTSITYIEDKIIDDDRVNQRGSEWTHVHFGLALTTVVNSFIHFLSRNSIHRACTLASSSLDQRANHWVLTQFEEIFREANYGQFLDIIYGFPSHQVSVDAGFACTGDPCSASLSDHINRLRTGQFIRRSAELGAAFGGLEADSDQLACIRSAMALVGICVQDLNDLQDFVPTSEFPGSCGKDLILLKKTFPIIRLIQYAEFLPEARRILDEVQDPSSDRAKLLVRTRELLADEGILIETVNRILSRLETAQTLLERSFTDSIPAVSTYFESFFSKAKAIIQQLQPSHRVDNA